MFTGLFGSKAQVLKFLYSDVYTGHPFQDEDEGIGRAEFLVARLLTSRVSELRELVTFFIPVILGLKQTFLLCGKTNKNKTKPTPFESLEC